MYPTIKIIYRTDQINKDGSHSIYLRVTFDRKCKYFAVDVSVLPKDWNEKTNRVRYTDSEYIFKNDKIEKSISKANNISTDLFTGKKTITLDEFSKMFLNHFASDSNFYDFVLDQIQKKLFAKETIRTYTSQISKIEQFKPKLKINQIDLDLVNEYKKYMIKTLGNKPNTHSKSLSMLKTFVNWAIEKDLVVF
jgi:hypothetical protein